MIQRSEVNPPIYGITKFEDFIFWFSIIDIFFLPYFRLISISFSVPFVAIWMLLHYRDLYRGKEAFAFFSLSFLMLAGTAIGLFYSEQLRFETSIETSIKRLFQYHFCFGYYFFYKEYFKRRSIDINKVLIIFTVVVSLYALYFMVSPSSYASIKMYLNPVDNHTARYLAGTHYYRFNYLWTDPNNIAYLMDGVVFWFAIDNNESFARRMLVLSLSAIVSLATASNGGMAILGFELVLILGMKFLELVANGRIKIRTILTFILLILALILVIRYTPIYQYIQTELIDKLRSRWTIYSTTSNLSGGRLADLKTAFQYLNPLLLFVGVAKEGFTTENGHIYWIGMYGFPAYICFMSIVFAKFKYVRWKYYVWIIPFFFAFTFNIAIGEFKWFAIYFLLLAASRYDEYYLTGDINCLDNNKSISDS